MALTLPPISLEHYLQQSAKAYDALAQDPNANLDALLRQMLTVITFATAHYKQVSHTYSNEQRERLKAGVLKVIGTFNNSGSLICSIAGITTAFASTFCAFSPLLGQSLFGANAINIMQKASMTFGQSVPQALQGVGGCFNEQAQGKRTGFQSVVDITRGEHEHLKQLVEQIVAKTKELMKMIQESEASQHHAKSQL